MKILNLVIHNSHIEIYEKMYNVLSPFYKRLDFVETFFIEYDETLDCEYQVNGDMLKLKGTESMIPGLLHKTIDALLILRKIGKEYDWIIRSNMSTVINFNILKTLLNKNLNYFGDVRELYGVDAISGIHEEEAKELKGLHFASGNMIGLSNEYANALLLYRHKLHFNLIDDVSIAVLFKEYYPDISCQTLPNKLTANIINEIDKETINNYNFMNNPVAWRNRNDNREIDIINMQIIVEVLNNSKNVNA